MTRFRFYLEKDGQKRIFDTKTLKEISKKKYEDILREEYSEDILKKIDVLFFVWHYNEKCREGFEISGEDLEEFLQFKKEQEEHLKNLVR